MMPSEGIGANIIQGPVHKAIDELVNHRDATGTFDRRDSFLQALQALQPADAEHTDAYLAILQQQAGVTATQAGYLRQHWYNSGPDSFWPAAPFHPLEPLVRQGLIKALGLAIQRNLPLESYWMPGGKDGTFEVIVTCSPMQQVTRILLTPMSPPPMDPATLLNFADIFVIKHDPVGQWEVAEPESQPGGVTITRLKTVPWPLHLP
jgi:hypothetical protein